MTNPNPAVSQNPGSGVAGIVLATIGWVTCLVALGGAVFIGLLQQRQNEALRLELAEKRQAQQLIWEQEVLLIDEADDALRAELARMEEELKDLKREHRELERAVERRIRVAQARGQALPEPRREATPMPEPPPPAEPQVIVTPGIVGQTPMDSAWGRYPHLRLAIERLEREAAARN